jgi:GTPase SAR1 family protein
MLCCGTVTKTASASNIDKQIKQDRDKATYDVKLLLLGTGDSGKSTFAKQMKIMYKGGFTSKELENYGELLLSRSVLSMHALIRATRQLKIRTGSRLKEPIDRILEAQRLSVELVSDMNLLWESKPIKEAFVRQSEFQLDTNAGYYLDNTERFAKPNFVPTNEDVLKVRQKTSGILETVFDTDGLEITLVDVGGQRSERRKWLHCFEDVTAVVYFVNLGEFDMALSEDYRVNRLTEALDLFEEISTSEYFSETDFFMFFNKDDMFREKVKSKRFLEHFKDYKGDGSYDSCLSFVTNLFKQKFGGPDNQYHVCVTISLAQDSIRQALEDVKEILKKRLSEVL